MQNTGSHGTEGLPEHVKRLRADNGFFVIDEERGNAGHAQTGGVFLRLFEHQQVLPAFNGARHRIGVNPDAACDLPEDIEIADIEAVRKVGGKHCFVKPLEFALFPGEFRCKEGQAGIGKDGSVHEGDPEGCAHGAKVLHHALDVLGPEPRCHGGPLGGRFRMDLYTPPFDLKIELLLHLFDDAVADVAEGSNVIGKDLNAYGHERDLVFFGN